jgi:hypothetical protein
VQLGAIRNLLSPQDAPSDFIKSASQNTISNRVNINKYASAEAVHLDTNMHISARPTGPVQSSITERPTGTYLLIAL